MKRTHYVIDDIRNTGNMRKITCEVNGEMSDGTKVWRENPHDNRWYTLNRIGKKYFFILEGE